jgi:diguanylate cyclase (GGDEF)-like protein
MDEHLETTWSSELSQRLYELVHAGSLESAEFKQGLQALAEEYQDEVYAELLYLLCHLRFEPDEAKGHWQGVAEHHRRMAETMQSNVDLRVALMSYFLDTQALLESPTVIELRLLENARNFAFRDSLTGLYNYRFFREFLPREIWRADQYNTPLSLVVADVDDFKVFNDRFGHEEGNVALSRIAVLLEESLRKVDIAVRYGGEEFVLILPATSKTGAQVVAERAREAVAGEEMHRGEKVSLSMGVATYPADGGCEADLLRHADRAMYLAKAKGKNQVELYGHDRRSFARVRTAINGKFRHMSPQAHPLETLDVSGGGLRFTSDRSMPLGSLVDVDLLISEKAEGIRLAGRVVDSKESGPGEFEVAIRVVEIDPQDRWQLGLYLRELSPTVGDPQE